ncbi:MAG TPA: hypothetical protein VIL46_16325, partial [Gemmataceae bacterium]
MRLYGLVLIASGLLAQAAGAEDGAAARGLIDGAIRAHGGEAALAKWPVVTVKTEGIFHGFERTPVFFFTSEMTNHGADQWRHVLDGALRGQKFRVTNVLDGGRGWVEL